MGWVECGGRHQQRERGVRRSGGRAACGLCAMKNASGPGERETKWNACVCVGRWEGKGVRGWGGPRAR